ncbi:MAG TPA: GerAB/ArcD/ProY family transporter [Acholeplasmataceae bacterium]|jgi:spore germination protein KB|nr:GerAB/ArcD/ProY family transporter [Acholeplasmataceae bacterium]
MEKPKYQITKGQFFIITFLYINADDIIRGIYAQELKQDIWISILMAVPLSVLLFFCYSLIFKISGKDDFASAIKSIVGRPFAFVLFVIYGLYFAFLAFLGIRDIAEVIIILMLHDIAIYMIGAAMLVVVLYGLYHGVEVFSRTTTVLFMIRIVAFVGFSTLIFASNRIHFKYFLPILENGFTPLIKPTLHAAYSLPFGKLFALLIVAQYVKDREKGYRHGYYGILFAGLILFLVTAYNIVILGPEAMILDIRPALRISKRIDVFYLIQRLDILVILLMIIMSFIKTWVLLFGAKYVLNDAFKRKNGNVIPFILCVLIVVALMFFPGNYIAFLEFRQKIVIPYINLPFEVIIPAILIILAFFVRLIRIIKSPATRENLIQ